MSILQNRIIREACVGSLEQALMAEKNGADRIELCARLDIGGTTPDEQLIKDCMEQLSIPTKVMIRPRGGNFVYNNQEIEIMLANIDLCQRLGVPELVMGVLTEEGFVDMDRMIRLSANIGTTPITFHKAIDEVPDVEKAILNLKQIPSIQYILSSGQAPTASEGKATLVKMIEYCGNAITIIAAGKVTNQNIEALHSFVQAKEYHGTKVVG